MVGVRPVKVKICGITNLEDALASAEAGCDALGFVFFKKSPRYIKVEKAQQIIGCLPKGIIKIGVFANAKEKTVKSIARICNLDILQFHGNESPEFCKKFRAYKIIKVFRIRDKGDLQNLAKYQPFAYLFDTFVNSRLGGTGKQFDWKLVRNIGNLGRPIFLSGGLTKNNLKKAISSVRPHWVDVSSSVEIRPGKKDKQKVKEFIQRAKNI